MQNLSWSLRPEPNELVAQNLASELNIDLALAKILVQRGVDTYIKAKDYFAPKLEDLHDPFLMKDMKKAVDRINTALESQEKILVFGDYDVDGTTAVSAMFSFLSEHTELLEYYIPDRYNEGYGISTQSIDYAKEKGFTLIIALDCGIKSVDKVAYAKNLGIDYIICDHHTPGHQIPEAVAVLNPKQSDCPYPYKELCGCGVGFKLVHALCIQNNWDTNSALALLDLVAISIAADIVPMTGENRMLCFFGIQKMTSQALRPGIAALLGEGKKEFLSVTTLVFTIAPRINAAGRISSGMKAVELMLCKTQEEALNSGVQINEHNSHRKELDQAITSEALAMISSNPEMLEAKTTVVYSEHWHKGVVGIVASRLIERYYRPTIVLTKSGETVAGSARSVSGFDVYEAISACSEHLLQYGGHKYAAGLTLLPEALSAFKLAFEKTVAQSIKPEHLQAVQDVDLELNFEAINPKFLRILERMEPFGPENNQPVFLTRGILDAGWARVVGEKHLKCLLFQSQNPNLRFDAIGFGLGPKLEWLKSGETLNVIYTIGKNTWNGETKIQLEIKDIKKMDEDF